MKIFALGESAARPRILLIDLEKNDAQALRDCGYKVYEGSSGLKDGLFNIPIEPHRMDIVIYRLGYKREMPGPDETIELYSMTDDKYMYRLGEGKTGTIKFKYPTVAPSSHSNFGEDLVTLRDNVLSKGGSILIFVGNLRTVQDQTIMQALLSTHAFCVYRAGGQEKEYELSFSCDSSMQEIRNYFKDLITGKTGHSVDFLRGLPLKDLRPDAKVYPGKQEFFAYDEDGIAYAYFVNRGTSKGNIILVPDFGATNVDIIKYVLSVLPGMSTEDLFSKEYQEGAWLEGEQYKFSDELDIMQQVDAIKRTFENRQSELEYARIRARAHTDYFRAILTNGDDDKSDEDEQLKPPLRKVLEWLEIEVIDLDKILKDKDEPLINDFILKVDGKEILCEAKGVTSGPRGDYVTQVNKHIVRFSKLKKQPALPGLLILNYQRDMDPNKRSEFYSDPAVVTEAEESEIGLLDTRELFKICKKIYGSKDDKDLKKRAREIIFSSGIIKCWPAD
jgi:hypothetical protein